MVGEQGRRFTLEGVALATVCAGYVAWVLSLPIFTTQDGPMHLYYAHVMLALFGHGPEAYGHFYRIKHLLPPYSAYYYLLIGLSRVVPLFLADKLVVCGYMVSFVYGFRYLARAVGPAAEQASLLATLLLLNWPLGMGFVNFCLGVSLALWTLGVWMRTVGQPGPERKALFVGMCLCLVLVHPVPLLAVLGYCTIDLGFRSIRRSDRFPLQRADVVCLALALATLGYVKMFTISHVTQQMLPNPESPLRQLVNNCIMYGRGQGLSFFSQFIHGASLSKRIYRLMLVVMVPLGLALALRQAVRDSRSGAPRPGRLWLWLTAAMIVVQPLVPHDMNASHYFADRLLIFVWIGALLAMSGYAAPGRAARISTILAAMAGTAAVLWTADKPMRAIGEEMARIERSPREHTGEAGIALGDWREQPASRTGLTFNPYLWGEVNYFRHNDAILYNTPWMDLTVIPLGMRQGLATGTFSPNAVEDARLMRAAMSDPELRRKALAGVQFAVENHFDRPSPTGPDPFLEGWRCTEEGNWFAVCER